jgi:hypothetical protein
VSNFNKPKAKPKAPPVPVFDLNDATQIIGANNNAKNDFLDAT